MTIEECKKYLPDGWADIIEQDPVLSEVFYEYEYDDDEAVPPFLFQDLRGELEHLRPILARYGQPGLDMLQGLLEIDEASKDTAERELPDGTTAYAAYFYARFSEKDKQHAINAARAYIKAINHIYIEVFEEDAPLDEDARIEFLTGQEREDFVQKMNQMQYCESFDDDLPDVDLIEWCLEIPYRKGCEEIHLMSEALYHISCDYNLSYYLQWPMFDTAQENPFLGYFDLWKLGLNIYFPARNRVVLAG